MLPTLEPVGPTDAIQHRLPRLQSQMIRIVQAKPTSRILELLIRQPLDTSLRRHRHEDGQRDGAMGQMKERGACLGDLNGDLVRWLRERHGDNGSGYGAFCQEV
jgi:hypothetical protein